MYEKGILVCFMYPIRLNLCRRVSHLHIFFNIMKTKYDQAHLNHKGFPYPTTIKTEKRYMDKNK